MKRWQSNHVEKNLLALIKLTRCTTLVKTELAGKRFLTDEEVEYLVRYVLFKTNVLIRFQESTNKVLTE